MRPIKAGLYRPAPAGNARDLQNYPNPFFLQPVAGILVVSIGGMQGCTHLPGNMTVDTSHSFTGSGNDCTCWTPAGLQCTGVRCWSRDIAIGNMSSAPSKSSSLEIDLLG